MNGMTATYSPDDNKLRLYAEERLDAETYTEAKAIGFIWAPKQKLFVAPAWSPAREDFLLSLVDEIGDDDKSLAERAEERAERFTEISERREIDAESAHSRVSSLCDGIPLGQPILVGHHSEKRARKDAERIETCMRKSIKLWEDSKYWKARAHGALRSAQYKERPGVRARRIKGLKADLKKVLKEMAKASDMIKVWSLDGITFGRAKFIANHEHISQCFTVGEFPRATPEASTYEGMMSLWSALTDGIIDEHQAQEIAIESHGRYISGATRWAAHYQFRIDYEQAMLSESGGLEADKHDLKVGGKVLARGEWLLITRINKKAGEIVSVTTTARYVPVVGIEKIQGYKPPDEGVAEKIKAASRLAQMTNFPMDGCQEMTGEEWKKLHVSRKGSRTVEASDEHGAYRHRSLGYSQTRPQPVYITDAKRVDPPKPDREADMTILNERTPDMAELQERADKCEASISTVPTKFDDMKSQIDAGVKVVTADQLFPTPASLADRMVELAECLQDHRILEPSAGTGRILDALVRSGLKATVAVEINPVLSTSIRAKHPETEVINADFMECGQVIGRFDRIIMNPPFAHGQDLRHTLKARKLLNVGGRLVGICAAGKKQEAVLRPMSSFWTPLASEAFAESGTRVNTVLFVIDRKY